MAKKLLTCIVLATLKGLDAKDPNLYIHPGPEDNPTLVELPDNAATQALIDDKLLRLYTGPVAAPVPDSEKVKELLAEVAELKSALGGAELTFKQHLAEIADRDLSLDDARIGIKNLQAEIDSLKGQLVNASKPAPALKPGELKSLQRARPALEALIARYGQDLATPDLAPEAVTAIDADLAQAQADLELVNAALK